ncbi:MAG: hypothetical protein U0176_06835 [Bacteroidia bacterium]
MSTIAPIAAVLTVDSASINGPASFAGHVLITNNDAVAIEVNEWQSSVPTLVLEIQDGKGKSVPHLPPPVPDEEAIDASWKALDPGNELRINYSGLSVDREFMLVGQYRVRFNGEIRRKSASPPVTQSLTSDWVTIEVRK